MQQTINVKNARQNISSLLDAVAAGDEFVITRRDKPVAKLSKISTKEVDIIRFPDRTEFRAKLPECQLPGSLLITETRNERR